MTKNQQLFEAGKKGMKRGTDLMNLKQFTGKIIRVSG